MSKTKSCPVCNNHFSPKHKDRKYCSPECLKIGRSRTLSIVMKGNHCKPRTGKIIQCKICSKNFYVNKSYPNREYCSLICKGIDSRIPIKTCAICGAGFWKPNMRRDRKYCSHKCSGIGRRKGKIIVCETCGKSAYKSPAFLVSPVHHFCSLRCANEWQGRNRIEYICKMCGIMFTWSQSRGQDYRITYCSQECRNKDPENLRRMRKMMAMQAGQNEPNKLELAGRKILQSMGVDFDEQVVMYDKFCVDICLTNYPVIIQWDGDYWHGNRDKFPELDHRQDRRSKMDMSQDAYLSKCGYMVLRFWESTVKKDPDKVVSIITEVLNDYN